MQDQDVLVDDKFVISKGQKDARQEQRRISQSLRLTETASCPLLALRAHETEIQSDDKRSRADMRGMDGWHALRFHAGRELRSE